MGKILSTILFVAALTIAGYWLQMLGGPSLRFRWLVALVLVYVAVSLAASTAQFIATRRLGALDAGELRDLANEDPTVADIWNDRTRDRERHDWRWQLTAAAWTVVGIAAPITLLPWMRNGWQIQPNTPIVFTDVLALGAATVLYLVLYRRALRSYRCPTCSGATTQLAGETLRMSCGNCHSVWRLSGWA